VKQLIRVPALVAAALLCRCGGEPPPVPVTATATAAPVTAAPAPPKGPTPPATPKRPVVTDYPGTKVTDDYAWLENGSEPEVKAWSESQNAFARSFLDGLEARNAVKDRVAKLLAASATYSELRFRGGTTFVLKDLPPKQQPFLVTLKSPEDDGTSGGQAPGVVKLKDSEHVLVDPNAIDPSGKTTIDWYLPSRDGKLVAVSLSSGGTEAGDVHVYDVATGKEHADVVSHVNGGTAGGSLAWNADATGIFYTRYPRAGERPQADMNFYQQVYFHKLGTQPEADTYEIGKDFPRIVEVGLDTSADGKLTLARAANGDGGEYAFYLRAPNGKWSQLSSYADKVVKARFGGDGALYMLSNAAARGQILRLDPPTAPLAKAQVIVPESDVVIKGLLPTKTLLYVVDMAGGPSGLRVFPAGAALKMGSRNVPILPVSQVSDRWSDGGLMNSEIERVEGGGGDDVVFLNESYVDPPAYYRYAASTGKVTKTALVKTTSADMSNAVVVRETCTSKDGTKVPLNVILKKGTVPSGSAPTLLTGYGGYDLSRSPKFRPLNQLWLEQGGIYAEANLRGGGEFGEPWHEGGKLLKKQNVFDDMAACANQLMADGYTEPTKLAIIGGSNGGLLMGAEITQHPELFRAVVSFVGIYDMLHVENTPNGAFNVTEYGTVKDPAQFKALFAYSPFHNVKDNTAYPSVLFLTGANDPRVDPYHSRKMTARLQAATSSGHPVLLRTSGDTGHIGSPLSVEIEEDADVYAFLFHELGVGYHAM
jgi:prolyl oligopeptidase